MGQRYRKMKDQNPLWPGLALKQDFAEGIGLKPKAKKRNCLNWGRVSKLV